MSLLQLELKLDLLGERILAGVDRRIEVVSARLEAAERRILASIDERLPAPDERTDSPRDRPSAAANSQAGAAARAKEQRSADDRKRLKERLKDAVEHDQSAAARGAGEAEREGWAEYLFGICKPDGRVGKLGSRWGTMRARACQRCAARDCASSKASESGLASQVGRAGRGGRPAWYAASGRSVRAAIFDDASSQSGSRDSSTGQRPRHLSALRPWMEKGGISCPSLTRTSTSDVCPSRESDASFRPHPRRYASRPQEAAPMSLPPAKAVLQGGRGPPCSDGAVTESLRTCGMFFIGG